MDYFFVVTALVLLAVSGIFSLVHQFHMLQQNSYFPSRYRKWLINSFSVWLAIYSILFCAVSLLYSNGRYFAMCLLSAFLLGTRISACIRGQKKAIKPLVFTGRIMRLFSAAAIVFLLLILVFAFNPEYLAGEICLVFSLMFSCVSPLLVFLCWGITLPIEKAFAGWYIKDAKRILGGFKSLKVVGITGSYGKTTTKFILNRLLSEKYNVVCTPQSFNTPMGIVRTIREKLTAPTQIFICEMGAKNIGDIKEICDIVHPDFGIITSVGPQHLETFKTVDNVFKTKFELAAAVKEKGGEVFVNGDSSALKERLTGGVLVYGGSSSFDFFAENVQYSAAGSTFVLHLKDEKISVSTKLLGMHSVNDIVGAAAVAYTLGVSAEEIKYAISSLKPTEHRLELKSFIGGSLVIDDAYNSNPEGCLEAVRVLGSFDNMKKVIITPGLIELGEKEYECNFALGLEAAKYCDIIILVGKNRSKPMYEAVAQSGFDMNSVYVVSSFKESMDVLSPMANSQVVTLIENDLPDNYLN
ncbi:MAG: UDP-N-acetylmuramoyl-tripeptide--D-alanyl-D-alanine ligase [Clostridia bacterium]|nr:UDP-N-acetylmuramoyl-tripeptide--D-alanyl-D-alanine ligase [Clostridia bacterium]